MDKKVVLVTGASRGVGRRIAMRLAECNYIVIANYNKSESKAKELEKYAVESGYDLTIYKADVTNRKEVKKMMDYREIGGTVFLGITKPVIKAHGSCDAKGVKNAIGQAMKLVSSDLCRDLAEKLAVMPAIETEQSHE